MTESTTEIARIRALLDAGETERFVAEMRALAAGRPDDVEVRMQTAYACDRYGTEEQACIHYDAAWRLGVPAGDRRKFMVGYGSTLRNVGRLDESLAILTRAVADYPDYPALPCFLALTLHSAGKSSAAVATLLSVVLDVSAPTAALDQYDRALAFYQKLLLEPE